MDLWERRLKKQGKKVMDNTRDALKRRGLDKDIDKEITKFKETVRTPRRVVFVAALADLVCVIN
jgi:hypothetical protein